MTDLVATVAANEMPSVSNETRPLDEVELRAWRGLLRAHATLDKRLDAELESAHGLPLTSYEVLLHLSKSEGRKMRMCDVAESVLLSRSGLTRLVDRLERDGYVERVSCADDARGAYARLTDAGREKLEGAIPLWEAAQRRIEDRLGEVDPDDARQALRALRKASR